MGPIGCTETSETSLCRLTPQKSGSLKCGLLCKILCNSHDENRPSCKLIMKFYLCLKMPTRDRATAITPQHRITNRLYVKPKNFPGLNAMKPSCNVFIHNTGNHDTITGHFMHFCERRYKNPECNASLVCVFISAYKPSP
jgi:hypothetical protein